MASTLGIVTQKAAKYHIPASVLWGVYGVETSHGSNVTTSSAGAKGSFQFIEGTAKSYRYPYTNATDQRTFEAQADSAAHYLSDLYKEHGTWEGALRAYSGGGYGWAEVSKQGSQSSGSLGVKIHEALPFLSPFSTQEIEKAESAVTPGPVKAAESAIKTTGKFIEVLGGWIENPLTPIKFVGGSVLLYIGVRTLTSGSGAERETRRGVGYALETATGATVAARAVRRSNRAVRRYDRKISKPKASAPSGAK